MNINYRRHFPDGTKNEFQIAMFKDFTTPILIGQAGYGSGKTYELCMHAIKLSWLNKGVPGGLLAPSFAEYKRDIRPTFEEIFQDNGLQVRIIGQDNTYYFPWSRKPMYIFTGEKRLRGPNIGWGCVNEFSLMQYERIKELIGRVRMRCPFPQKVLVGTPDDIFGWYDEFLEKNKGIGPTGTPKMRIIQGKTTDNAFYLDPNYVPNMLDVLDPQAVRLFIYGHKVNLNSAAFYFSFNQDRHALPEIDRDPALDVHVACDFNVGNMHALCANVVPGRSGKVTRVFEEIVLKSEGSNTEEMGKAIATRFGQDPIITCDASGKNRKTTGISDIKVLRGMGFRVLYRSANPRIRMRQLLVNGLLSHDRILINREKCPVLIRDLNKVAQDPATFDKIGKDPNLTHASDCLDYLCDFEYELNITRDQFQKRKVGSA